MDLDALIGVLVEPELHATALQCWRTVFGEQLSDDIAACARWPDGTKAFFQMVCEEILATSGRTDVLTERQFLAVLRLACPSETPSTASDLESQFKDLVDLIFVGDGHTRAEIVVRRLTEISTLQGITDLSELEDPMRIEMTEEDEPLGEDEEQQGAYRLLLNKPNVQMLMDSICGEFRVEISETRLLAVANLVRFNRIYQPADNNKKKRPAPEPREEPLRAQPKPISSEQSTKRVMRGSRQRAGDR